MADQKMTNVQRSKLGPVHIPDNLSYPDLILHKMSLYGDRVALINAETDIRITYSDLICHIRSLASAIYRRGVSKGEVMMIFSPNHILYHAVQIAVAYVGGVTSTANPNYTPEELRYMIDDSQCTRLVTLSSLLPVVTEALRGYTNIKEVLVLDTAQGYTSIQDLLDSGDPEFISPVMIRPRRDILFLPYSSGTTGRSKGVMLTHYNIVANVYQNHPTIALGPQPHETFVAFLPFYHIYAMSVIQALGLVQGYTIVVIQKYSLDCYLNSIYKYKATFLHLVPPVVLQLAKSPHVQDYMTSVHTLYCGGAPLGSAVERKVLLKTGVNTFRQGYGLTETSPSTHTNPVVGSKHGACGILLPNTECKIRDLETSETLGAYKDGELLIRGPQVMTGYWRNPDATSTAIDHDDWFYTGDIGHYDEDGFFYVVDRLKELIKWKGLQVAPAELEHVLVKHPSIADAAVVGILDEVAGELPKAYVVLKPEQQLTEDTIIQYVAEHVAPHKRLRGGVEIIQQIPKSPSGKLLRRLLRSMARGETPPLAKL